jgi:hypothetical protein
VCARNCLPRERDNGPALLNVGTRLKPLKIPRSEAWQQSYSMWVLRDCEGDHARIIAARQACAERQAGAEASDAWEAWSRAVDLCDQALRLIEGIGAIGDDRARQILVAVCEYETSNTALGVIDGVAEDNARELTEALREAGATMSDVPSPETLVNWAFPWL